MNDDTDYTSVDEAFFRRGEEIEHTPVAAVDSFEDLDDGPVRPQRPALWPPVRARLAALAHAVPKPRAMSRRGRRIALGSAGMATLCIIALAVPNGESHVAAGVAQPVASANATPALASEPTPELAPEPVLAPKPVLAPEPVLAPKPEPKPAPVAKTTSEPAPQAHRRATHADRRAAKPEPKRPRARRDSRSGKQHYDRGLHAWNRGDIATARKEFIASTRAGHAAGYRALGVLFRKQGNKSQAIRAFRAYLRAAPKSGDAAKVRRMLTALER